MIPGIDLVPDDEAEGYVKERLWSHPENVRALTDASYHFNVPRVLSVSVLGPEIFAMQSGARRSVEDLVSSVHEYDTFSEGIAQLQVRHAVRFFPALYEDATSPGAPLYLRNAIAPYAYLYGSIGDRDDDGALTHFQQIKEILQNDTLCIYMMTMYIREAMEILHRADPSFRDPNTFDALSIPTAFEASAIGSYYVYGPPYALNPNATSVWNEVVGSEISAPEYNIYIIRVRQDGWDWLEMDRYLKQQGAISMDYSAYSTFSEVMYWMLEWLNIHGSLYDEGLFGVFLDNNDLRLAQSLPPQYAYLASMFAHSNVYGFNVPYSYPNNWQAIQTPTPPAPVSPPTETPPSVHVGDLPEGFEADAQGIFYTVQPGDNLWSIATTVYEDMKHLYPDAIDINSVLSVIVSLNDIPDSAAIDIGQKIYVYSFLNSNAGSMHRYSMMPAGLGLAMARIRAPSVGTAAMLNLEGLTEKQHGLLNSALGAFFVGLNQVRSDIDVLGEEELGRIDPEGVLGEVEDLMAYRFTREQLQQALKDIDALPEDIEYIITNLIAHPGRFRDTQGISRATNLFILDEHYALLASLEPTLQAEWARHERAHLDDITRSERDIQTDHPINDVVEQLRQTASKVKTPDEILRNIMSSRDEDRIIALINELRKATYDSIEDTDLYINRAQVHLSKLRIESRRRKRTRLGGEEDVAGSVDQHDEQRNRAWSDFLDGIPDNKKAANDLKLVQERLSSDPATRVVLHIGVSGNLEELIGRINAEEEETPELFDDTTVLVGIETMPFLFGTIKGRMELMQTPDNILCLNVSTGDIPEGIKFDEIAMRMPNSPMLYENMVLFLEQHLKPGGRFIILAENLHNVSEFVVKLHEHGFKINDYQLVSAREIQTEKLPEDGSVPFARQEYTGTFDMGLHNHAISATYEGEPRDINALSIKEALTLLAGKKRDGKGNILIDFTIFNHIDGISVFRTPVSVILRKDEEEVILEISEEDELSRGFKYASRWDSRNKFEWVKDTGFISKEPDIDTRPLYTSTQSDKVEGLFEQFADFIFRENVDEAARILNIIGSELNYMVHGQLGADYGEADGGIYLDMVERVRDVISNSSGVIYLPGRGDSRLLIKVRGNRIQIHILETSTSEMQQAFFSIQEQNTLVFLKEELKGGELDAATPVNLNELQEIEEVTLYERPFEVTPETNESDIRLAIIDVIKGDNLLSNLDEIEYTYFGSYGRIDYGAMRKMFRELIVNAIRACHEAQDRLTAAGISGKLRIAIRRQGTNLIIEVEDNGNGIRYQNRDWFLEKRHTTKEYMYFDSGHGMTFIKSCARKLGRDIEGGKVEVFTRSADGRAWTKSIELDPFYEVGHDKVELKDDDKELLGTLIRITIPIHPLFVPGTYYERDVVAPANLEELQETVVLFSGEEAQDNFDDFRRALDELDETNTAVVIVDSDEQRRFFVDHRGELGRFYIRTPGQLGLASFDLEQVMTTIMGIDNLRCIPLTDSLLNAYPSLEQARDQV
ncbi:ATP-binding protein [Candidatus Omnitrophota bacterium]